ncbi:DUF2989 domain-containing protein [Aestuariibacter halophilus]|uniref:DUF2989 domain-containing protein n=1 Tax=Fluctibacter halophilus TaxID=226011 RepID=A0ABS8GBG4_9ALTE|nr:DUF2989 domain-containing protein [Aestuariibacter halophilus]MCC2617764.1 DUF2989 domain-containing protein [Aestuariibacter halophilus]
MTLLLSACQKQSVAESSIWKICEKYPEVCDATHSGALCGIQKNDTIRAVAQHHETLSSLNAYNALKTLEKYRLCLEDAYVSENVRNKKDKQSQVSTIRKIPEIQRDIMADTRSLVRPEINLWLWQNTQNDDYLESIKNGVEMAESIHPDVYIAMMYEAARHDLEKARDYARKVLANATVIADIEPKVYEFYIEYYIRKEDFHKAAIWQGLYSARDKERAEINADYFQLHEKMTDRQMANAQSKVEELLFDARWLNKSMSEFPRELI